MWKNPKYQDTTATAPPEERGQRLATFVRDRGDSELRVCLDEYEGHPFVSVRLWTRGPDGWFPTPKGCSIRMGELRGLLDALAPLAGRPDSLPQGRQEPRQQAAAPRSERSAAPPARRASEPAGAFDGNPRNWRSSPMPSAGSFREVPESDSDDLAF